jgi:hypothetical protein
MFTLAAPREIENSPNAFSCWLGKSVVLLVAIRQYCVPLPCTIVGESETEVYICMQDAWEQSVRKELILAVEEMRVAGNRPRQANGPAVTLDSMSDAFVDTDLRPKRVN